MSVWQPDDQAPKSVWDLHRSLDGRLVADGDGDEVDRIELDYYWDTKAHKRLVAGKKGSNEPEDEKPSWLGRLFG
jgi:hypothetical protein